MTEGGGWDLADEKDMPPLVDQEGGKLDSGGHWDVIPNPTDGEPRVGREEDVPGPLRCDVRHNVTGVVFTTGG